MFWNLWLAGLGIAFVFVAIGLPAVANVAMSSDWPNAIARLLIYVAGMFMGAAIAMRGT